MRITESQLRKIVRQEVRRLSEVAPGVRAPRQPDMTADDLRNVLLDLDDLITERLVELGFEDLVEDPQARLAAFEGRGLDLPAGYDEDTGEEYEQVHDQVSVVELNGADVRHIGKAVGGLEHVTDGSALAVILDFKYDPRLGVCANLDTDHGVMTVCVDDL